MLPESWPKHDKKKIKIDLYPNFQEEQTEVITNFAS